MAFDVKSFKKSEFSTRSEEVRVEGLAEWFEEEDEPVFIVRGLSGREMAVANEASERNTAWTRIMEAMSSSNVQDQIQAIQRMMGLTPGEEVPDSLAKRHEHLKMGAVDPELDHEAAVKLAERYPVEFYQLTNKIMELSGKGAYPVKKKGSGKTQEFKPASPSETDKEDASSS